jgi:branched-chain amino acid transport system ATP-binding protein
MSEEPTEPVEPASPAKPSEPAIPALKLAGIRGGYGRIEVLHDVDLVAPGGVTALLGANGAGKSTLLKVITGQLRATAGEVQVAGKPLGGSVTASTRAGVCLVPEGRGVFPSLTVDENLVLASYFGVPASELRERVYERFPKLAQRRRQKAGSMSGGEQQMLAVGRALASKPKLLLLDELSMGLAPLIVAELYAAVAEAAAGGMAVVVVEQYAERALAVADTAAIMRGGRIVASGPPDSVRDRLEELYLGGAA